MIKQLFLPVKEFHRGNTACYMERALSGLGLGGKILDEAEFIEALHTADDQTFFLCIDSGGAFDFNTEPFNQLSLNRVGYWLIDFRHHREGPRAPTDLEICQTLNDRGGWIFQSQFEDCQFCLERGWRRSIHLPLAADPEIWSDVPVADKRYHLAFAGNVWDEGRARVLETVLKLPGLKFGFPGHGGLWMEEAAALIRSALIGFNVNSWYGSGYDYDLNMRFYETLSCGVPLITNWIPALDRLFPDGVPFIATYKSSGELPGLIEACLGNRDFLGSGSAARKWVTDNSTYQHRVREVLAAVASAD